MKDVPLLKTWTIENSRHINSLTCKKYRNNQTYFNFTRAKHFSTKVLGICALCS